MRQIEKRSHRHFCCMCGGQRLDYQSGTCFGCLRQEEDDNDGAPWLSLGLATAALLVILDSQLVRLLRQMCFRPFLWDFSFPSPLTGVPPFTSSRGNCLSRRILLILLGFASFASFASPFSQVREFLYGCGLGRTREVASGVTLPRAAGAERGSGEWNVPWGQRTGQQVPDTLTCMKGGFKTWNRP